MLFQVSLVSLRAVIQLICHPWSSRMLGYKPHLVEDAPISSSLQHDGIMICLSRDALARTPYNHERFSEKIRRE